MASQLFMLFYLSVFFGVSNAITMPPCTNSSNTGTTVNFEQIFLGRCFYFINVLHATDCNIKSQNINCTALLDQYSRAVINKTACQVTIDDFTQFLRLAYHPINVNTTLFWSGTYNPAHAFSKSNSYWTLEDTLSGYLLNELIACSTTNSSSFSYDQCPSECIRANNPFWNAASREFAAKASGYIQIVLNGTRATGAVSEASTFFRHELPALNASQVRQLRVLLVYNPDQPKYETCREPKSLAMLKQRVEARRIEYACEDSPDVIKFYMCFANPFSKECVTLKYLINEGGRRAVSSSDRFLMSLLVFFSLIWFFELFCFS